ncbi:hypothetical protein [Salininema proteolyticum]|uniref:Uncharacterized protein n=1 Tax=Salininema proteolyticum TaxID=1607685 RepID=A0ABV8U567_9ACTN
MRTRIATIATIAASAGTAVATPAATVALLAATTPAATADLGMSPALRFLPAGTALVAAIAVALAGKRTAALSASRDMGYLALLALMGTSVLTALSHHPALYFAGAAASGAAAGFAIAAGREALDVFGVRWVVALALGVAAAAVLGAMAIEPYYGWRGLFGLAALASFMSLWAFGANVRPVEVEERLARAA